MKNYPLSKELKKEKEKIKKENEEVNLDNPNKRFLTQHCFAAKKSHSFKQFIITIQKIKPRFGCATYLKSPYSMISPLCNNGFFFLV